jgi:hypothetical protein
LQTSARREIGANRIRRVQALAAYTPVGVDAGRFLLGVKVRGQAATLSRLPAGAGAERAFRFEWPYRWRRKMLPRELPSHPHDESLRSRSCLAGGLDGAWMAYSMQQRAAARGWL